MFEDNIYDDVLNEDSNVLNQSINGEDAVNFDENEDPEGQGGTGDGQAAEPAKVEVKIRKQRNVLRPIERFMGERGLQSVGEYFKDVRYQGKHHEKEDINMIMGRMQHWAHRAFPTMKFDDALTIVEGLTKKRIVQTHMTKYRLDMLQPAIEQTEEDREGDDIFGGGGDGVAPMDEFDDLLGDQIEQMTRVQQQKGHSTALNNTSMMNQSDVSSLGCSAIPSTPQPAAKKTSLTSEQMAKIAENRLKALERLKQKQAEAAAQLEMEREGDDAVNESITIDSD